MTVGWILLVGIEAWKPIFKSCCIDPSEALHKRTIQQPVTRKALVANTRIYLLSILFGYSKYAKNIMQANMCEGVTVAATV